MAISDYLTVIMARNGANKGRKATKKRRKAQQKATGAVKGKKLTFTLEQRIHTCRLRKEGMEPYQISDALHTRYGLELSSSTLSSLYNATAMTMYEDLVKRGSLMNSVEAQVNRT